MNLGGLGMPKWNWGGSVISLDEEVLRGDPLCSFEITAEHALIGLPSGIFGLYVFIKVSPQKCLLCIDNTSA